MRFSMHLFTSCRPRWSDDDASCLMIRRVGRCGVKNLCFCFCFCFCFRFCLCPLPSARHPRLLMEMHEALGPAGPCFS